MGSPQEEIWVTRNRERIHATLIILVEGLFEMYAGNVRMKMKYTRRWSLETAPKRDILYHRPMKRSFLTPIFILSVFIEKLFWKKR
jgi:UDP-N-acetyl-D-mannosaminuronic acid transferase (WecB/TagA/CpsF family)